LTDPINIHLLLSRRQHNDPNRVDSVATTSLDLFLKANWFGLVIKNLLHIVDISAECFKSLLKRICSLDTSAFSALEFIDDYYAI